MSAQHTPGPWRVSSVGLTNDGKRAVVSEDAGIAWAHPQTAFKRGDGWQHECGEREANARLIAAAPDLLAALEAMRDDPTIKAVCRSPLWAQMVDAIAKARE